MKNTNFRGEPTDISAEKEVLVDASRQRVYLRPEWILSKANRDSEHASSCYMIVPWAKPQSHEYDWLCTSVYLEHHSCIYIHVDTSKAVNIFKRSVLFYCVILIILLIQVYLNKAGWSVVKYSSNLSKSELNEANKKLKKKSGEAELGALANPVEIFLGFGHNRKSRSALFRMVPNAFAQYQGSICSHTVFLCISELLSVAPVRR